MRGMITDLSDIKMNEVNTDNEEIIVKKKAYAFFKRCFDIVSSFTVMIFISIPMLIVALIICVKDGGSPLYVQKRVGRNGRIFGVYKFRSMKQNADHLEEMLTPEQLEEYKKEYKLDDDPRLIGYEKPGDGSKCFGAFIRKVNIDELPQIFFNILIKGNMSVVGPRPILESELQENYTEEQQKLICSVKPGLTGYWQAYARNDATYETGERQRMELFYIKNRSFLFDLKIIFVTIISVFKGRGAK